MRIYQNISELIGNTPLLRLNRIEEKYGLKARLIVKIESGNPAGSAKDRVALEMINSAEREGRLMPGGTVIEPTSGNTGIALAAICANRGYRAIIIMPDTMSIERCKLVKAYGAELILTPGAQGMQGAVDKANELLSTIPGSIIAGQFNNPANPAAHYGSTGPEIWRDTDGEVDLFIAGVGTGGTISGTGAYLKEMKPSVQVIGVEPAESPLISTGKAGPHGIQGIGANFIPENFNREIVDEIMAVKTDDAMQASRELTACEGILCGISSGAALYAGIEAAKRAENAGKTIVVLLPDGGERYMSTALFC